MACKLAAKGSILAIENEGAVIFGYNQQYPWYWADSGEPSQTPSIQDRSQATTGSSSHDSGYGKSVSSAVALDEDAAILLASDQGMAQTRYVESCPEAVHTSEAQQIEGLEGVPKEPRAMREAREREIVRVGERGRVSGETEQEDCEMDDDAAGCEGDSVSSVEEVSVKDLEAEPAGYSESLMWKNDDSEEDYSKLGWTPYGYGDLRSWSDEMDEVCNFDVALDEIDYACRKLEGIF
ncbi:hypothetical protein N8T08_010769 [Aspergillus melleus]|uniref:Uncharacterized protein n=1 Tax=Aspergillus melleus TaxID=138277 RepID=A0ACC3BBV4_9EURO|nr:hypothetical protein N8T08_010769 [Aspergillus melleus]